VCGIAGAIELSQRQTPKTAAVVSSIVNSQKSRGPDYQRVEHIVTSQVSIHLGHNRLSIIDLSNAAHQPFWDVDQTWCMVFNGEIYNYLELKQELVTLGYPFHTRSDTEVLLAAFKHWGEAAIEKFNGMFAIAIYSVTQQKLWLIRDRFGVKPLFYLVRNNILYFASTSQELAKQFNLVPNKTYLGNGINYLVYESSADYTAYEELHLIKPSTMLRVSFLHEKLTLSKKSYYHLPDRVNQLSLQLNELDDKELADKVTYTLNKAIDIRLRADVPLGISLSGGLDSTTIAALAHKKHPEIIGFTYGSLQEPRSEAKYAKLLQDKLNIVVHYIPFEDKHLTDKYQEILAAQDAPFPSLSIVAQNYVYEQARQQGIKVMLGGQGGDENFLGYRKFFLMYYRHLIKEKKYLAAFSFLGSLLPLLMHESFKVTQYWKSRHRYFRARRSHLFPMAYMDGLQVSAATSLQQRQILDITDYSLPTLLRYEDRNSMAHSIESRLPFMDFNLVELGVALPTHLKINRGYGKWIIRQISQGLIPDEIRLAKFKKGFDALDERWIDAGLGQEIRKLIEKNRAILEDFLHVRLDIKSQYSDYYLKHSSFALKEAITLNWLAMRL